MWILGISAFYHDSAAALIRDGQIVAAAQEERFTRKKHDPAFPAQAITYCLKEAGITLDQVERIVFFEKPYLKFERLLETYLSFAPRGLSSFMKAMPLWIKEKLFQKKYLDRELKKFADGKSQFEKIYFAEHHQSHAASAFYPSPFEEALVLTMDGVGEWTTTSVSVGRGTSLRIIKELRFPHSLGLLYSAFTYFTGFKVNSGEYKVMGLAPYGVPRFKDLILKELVDLKADGSFRLNLDYFTYPVGLTMTADKFERLFACKTRSPEQPLEQIHMDLAASVQAVTEEIVLRMTRALARETKINNICLAGGVALNCVANGKILRDAAFKNVWIQPAAGDAGGAVGAALAYYFSLPGSVRQNQGRDGMSGAYLGPEFSDSEIESALGKAGARYSRIEPTALAKTVAKTLSEGRVVGWFQGRMEFGPRALGGRSIIADPRNREMQKTLNLKIKFRESFRPFAPAVLREDVKQWFELDQDSPYMLLVADVAREHRIQLTAEEDKLFGIEKLNTIRSSVPSITHVDYSARIQTVHHDTNPKFHDLIREFKSLTGCPIVVNTSFNVRGEPIVGSPLDAFRCFMGTDMDTLVVGNYVMHREDQDEKLRSEYYKNFELD